MAGPALQCVDFARRDGQFRDGLVAVKNVRTVQRLDEKSALRDAAGLHHVDYVFFRRFDDGRSSQVAAYVVDNSNERLNNSKLAKLHQQVWLQGTAPLLYVAWPTRVDILSCARGPDFWNDETAECEYRPYDHVESDVTVAAEIDAAMQQRRQRYSALRLADGTFWDDPENAPLADHDQTAHRLLIQAVVETDRAIKGDKKPVLRRLLLLAVLVKYLEDRRVFPRGWFGRFHGGATSFFHVLAHGGPANVLKFLKEMESKFNGDIFALPVDKDFILDKETLAEFARLVEAKTLAQQGYLWEQFSFEHLPVEVISHLYQRFVHGGHGTVYTPPFLAALLLDHAMPYDTLTGKERVLDPACGSGVFLVGAYRRLVNAWRGRNRWKRPNVATLKSILKNSIFGIELDPGAIDLTAFSLALAVCDALKPEIIWRQLRFDPLRANNLLEGDFFKHLLAARNGQNNILANEFDVVLGNPPFESELTGPGKEISKPLESARGKIPDEQAAYLFLEQGIESLRPGGRLCLIQPAGILYNRNTESLRNRIVKHAFVEAVLDFTSIRKLFAADPKVVALVAIRQTPKADSFCTHLTFRRTFSVHQRIGFELDHYDRHRIAIARAQSDPYVWRANLLGGGRLVNLSDRLRTLQSLAQFVEVHGWDYGEGFIAAKTGRREPAPFLTGKPLLPTAAFTVSGIDELSIETVRETHFRSAYTEKRFSPPLVLIKELDSLPIAFWDKGFLAYRHKIVGIHADHSQTRELKRLFDDFRKRQRLYQFCCALNGSQALVGKATAILKQDIDALPYPKDDADLVLSYWEQALVDDVLQYMAQFVRLGQNSDLLRRRASGDNLAQYCDLFCRMLGSVYKNLKSHSPIILNGVICQPFFFGDKAEAPWAFPEHEDELQQLIYQENLDTLRTVRVVRLYSENTMAIVKPDRLRYWIRSTAIRDADETLVDLRQQGY